MKRDYVSFLVDIVKAIDDIFIFINDMDFNQFTIDRKTFFAVVQRFTSIGEAVKKLPENLKDKYSLVPWKTIAGMRDNLVHEYYNIESKILWMTIQSNLTTLKLQILQVIEDLKKIKDQEKLG